MARCTRCFADHEEDVLDRSCPIMAVIDAAKAVDVVELKDTP